MLVLMISLALLLFFKLGVVIELREHARNEGDRLKFIVDLILNIGSLLEV